MFSTCLDSGHIRFFPILNKGNSIISKAESQQITFNVEKKFWENVQEKQKKEKRGNYIERVIAV